MSTRISLDRVVTLRVPVAWHEAVAVAHQVAQAVEPGVAAGRDELLDFARERTADVRETVRAGRGLDTCLISVTGNVDVTWNSRAPFTADAALSVLRALLDEGQAPRELVSLIKRHGQEPSADGFVDDLKFFMRPDAAADIGALATRAITAETEAAQLEEFERLRQGAAGTTSTARSKQEGFSRETPARKPLALAAAAVAVLASVGALALGAGKLSPLLSATPAPASSDNQTSAAPAAESSRIQRLTGQIDALVDKGLATLGLTPGDASSVAPIPEAPPPAPRLARRATRSRADLAASTAPVIVVMPPPAIESSRDAIDLTIPADAEPEFPADLVFDAEGDSGVEPPVLRWPQLPHEAEDVEPGTPYFELLINETGRVDKVRLRSSRGSFHDSMLVSAAKAWLFHPAHKDGRPVKYLMKVPLVTSY